MMGGSGRVLSPALLQSHSILVGTLRAKKGIWQVTEPPREVSNVYLMRSWL